MAAMTITNELASALQELVTTIKGYKNCPTLSAMTVNAERILARYAQAQRVERAADWLEDNYPLIRAEWEDAQRPTFHLWLQAHYPDVWRAYLKQNNSST